MTRADGFFLHQGVKRRKHKCPCSAAFIAVLTVSRSLISPTNITSGSSRKALSAVRKAIYVLPDTALIYYAFIITIYNSIRIFDGDNVIVFRVI